MSTWEDRVRRDADLVYKYMVSETPSGRVVLFSIDKIQNDTRLARDRVCGALVDLVMIENKVIVTGDRPELARFYLKDIPE